MSALTVIKIGGALVSRPDALDALWSAVARISASDRVVLVHGGGPAATELARRLGHEPQMIHGRRVTTDLDLRIVEWTMRGELNTHLVARARRAGVKAAGVSGVDGSILRVVRRPPWIVDDERVDFGWVGDVASVDTELIDVLIPAGYVPVVAPLGVDTEGRVYNVNADTVSCALAAALNADRYLLVTEVGGVLREADDPDSKIDVCTFADFHSGVSEGWIQNGMRVKLEVAFNALVSGVDHVYVLSPYDIDSPAKGTRIVSGDVSGASREMED